MSGNGAETLRLAGVSAAPGSAPVLHDVDLTVAAGTTTSVVGPSGAGKTTLLRVVAGLEAATAGRVLVGGDDLTGVPAHRRGIGVVFQEPRLLPHRTVVDNVAFGLEAAGVPPAERQDRATALLDAVGLTGFGDRGVRGLSGGEQQRVNLARALALEPRVLLLDEPLAAVDPERRAELRELVASLTTGRTTLHVTHDLAEAAELADDVAVLLDGRIAQHDAARTVFERPATAAVARFVGATNLLRGTVREGALCLDPADGAGPCELPAVGGPDGPAVVAVRPEHVRLGGGPLRAVVTDSSYRGTHARLALALPDGQVLHADVAVGDAPAVGTRTHLTVRGAHRLPHPDPHPDHETTTEAP